MKEIICGITFYILLMYTVYVFAIGLVNITTGTFWFGIALLVIYALTWEEENL